MILKEEKPKNRKVGKFIDRYQFYQFDEPSILRAIPNGKIELYIVLDGHLERWDNDLEAFISCGAGGIFPASNQATYYKIPDSLVCLNLKLNLKILSLESFKGLLKNWKDISVSNILGESRTRTILELTKLRNTKVSFVPQLDLLLEGLFNESEEETIASLLDYLEKDIQKEYKVNELAKILNISTKTLERKTQKYFKLSPKDLLNIFRFEQTTAHIQQSESPLLMDALEFGYYDQSHFIKNCKKITGYAPKAFFSKLILPTNDLIFEDDLPERE